MCQKMSMENKIIRFVEEKGPTKGSELLDAFGGDGMMLWRTCHLSPHLIIKRAGSRYLRLDRRVKGFARLSPSILREFLTYSIVGLSGDVNLLEQRVRSLLSRIEDVNRAKLELAYRTVSSLTGKFDSEWSIRDHGCFLIGGDIVYNMAHDVPRPERSTGKLVNGSDIDLVVILDDAVPDALMKRLDDALLEEKYRLLITPHIREEIDYVVKKVARVREQVRFDTFRHMVACKILYEGTLLYGNKELFSAIKAMLRKTGVAKKLDDLEKAAETFRRDAVRLLLSVDTEKLDRERAFLFYSTEESEEFE